VVNEPAVAEDEPAAPTDDSAVVLVADEPLTPSPAAPPTLPPPAPPPMQVDTGTIITALSALASARSEAELREAISSATALKAHPLVCAAYESARERLVEAEQQTRGEAPDEGLCVVCVDAAKSHVFVECMHKCVCEECAELLLAKDPWRGTVHADGAECPLCRVMSKSVRKVFE
jgi:hypothetical protein